MNTYRLNFYTESGDAAESSDSHDCNTKKLVCTVEVPESFFSAPTIKDIRLFSECVNKNMLEKEMRCINITHPKLTRQIAISYMKHLKWRSELEEASIKIQSEIFETSDWFFYYSKISDLIKEGDPSNYCSIYITSLSDYLGDPYFEQNYFEGAMVQFSSSIYLQNTNEISYSLYDHMKIDKKEFYITPGYKNISEIIQEIKKSVPGYNFEDGSSTTTHVNDDDVIEFLPKSDNIQNYFLVSESSNLKINPLSRSFLTKSYRLWCTVYTREYDMVCDDDYPLFMSEFGASVVAENYLEDISSKRGSGHRKFHNFATKNPNMASVIWGAGNASHGNSLDKFNLWKERMLVCELLTIPKKSQNKLAKMNIEEASEYSNRIALAKEAEYQNFSSDPELKRLECEYDRLAKKFYVQGYFKIYKISSKKNKEMGTVGNGNDESYKDIKMFVSLRNLQNKWEDRLELLKAKHLTKKYTYKGKY